MLIIFLNASDMIGCDGNPLPVRLMQGTWRGVWKVCRSMCGGECKGCADGCMG